MSDDLAVGGPGFTSVLTTELVDLSCRFTALRSDLDGLAYQLAGLDRIIGKGLLRAVDAPQSALLAESAMDDAAARVHQAMVHSDQLARGLSIVAARYDAADRFASALGQELSADLAYEIGVFSPFIATALLPSVLYFGSAGATALLLLPEQTRARLFSVLGSWFKKNSAALSDPRVVDLVRTTVMSADDFGEGRLGLPPGLVHLLGDGGLGITGVDTSAAAIGVIGSSIGLFKETPVRVTSQGTALDVPAVRGTQDRAMRIPTAPEQIRIDRYSSPGEPDRFEVYIAGTADLSASSGREPWDMTSNVTALGGRWSGPDGAGSFRAVEEAMRQAGIDASSSVTLTGYSQGGLIAAQLAASGNYSIDGLLTFGAPAGQVAVPHDIPYLAIEHTNDLVPALGGTFVSSDPTVVRRELFDGAPAESDVMLPAHQLSNYSDTARLVDRSDNEKISAVLGRLRQLPAESVSSTVYVAVRE